MTDTFAALQARFARSRTFRDLEKVVRLAHELAALAEQVAERIPAAAEDGLFDCFDDPESAAHHMVRDLQAMAYGVSCPAAFIEGQLPHPPAPTARKRRAKRTAPAVFVPPSLAERMAGASPN